MYLKGHNKYLLLLRYLPEKVKKATKDVNHSNWSSGPVSKTGLPEHDPGR
jgi:hypothetical protein